MYRGLDSKFPVLARFNLHHAVDRIICTNLFGTYGHSGWVQMQTSFLGQGTSLVLKGIFVRWRVAAQHDTFCTVPDGTAITRCTPVEFCTVLELLVRRHSTSQMYQRICENSVQNCTVWWYYTYYSWHPYRYLLAVNHVNRSATQRLQRIANCEAEVCHDVR